MEASELNALQAFAGRSLPGDYLELLSHPQFASDSRNAAVALLRNPQDILAWNAELREGEHAADWRTDWFAIGWSPAGDAFFLDLREDSPRVYSWNHETHEVFVESPSLREFADSVSQWEAPDGWMDGLTEAQRVWQADQARRIRVGLWVTAAILIVCLLIPVVIGCVMYLVRATSRIP